MASKHVVSMSIILAFFRDHAKQFERGENAYTSGHVVHFHFDPEGRPALLKGKVEASMRKTKYDVEITIDLNQGTISDAKCNCPRGQVVCHHMAALCIHAYHNVSSTDVACAWNMPGPSRGENIKSLPDIFPPSKPDYQAIGRLPTDAEVTKFKEDLSGNIVGFSWLLQPDPTSEAFIIPQIEEIILSEEHLQSLNKREYLENKCVTDEETRRAIIAATKGQASNPNWLLARKFRLTASKFGAVLGACKRGKFPASLYKRLLEGYDLGGVKAVQWGTQHEKTALEEFALTTGMPVEATGLWLHPCGFLGASPDGLVDEDKLVEVKCPYKYRNMKLSEILLEDKSYIIFKNDSNETIINKYHEYYSQIQGQLHLCEKEICFLIVWTPQETEILEVKKDPEWEVNIDILKEFYLDKFIPHILGNK